MPDIDTSQYPKARNPLETITGFANLQNTLNQNKLFQQEFQSKLGLSKLYKDAIDPKTGQIDPSKIDFRDPDVTYGLPQAFQNSQEAQQRNINIDISKVQQAQAHLKAVSGYFAPLMQPGATAKDVALALAHAETNGLVDEDNRNRIWASLPRNQQTGLVDDSQIPAWAQQQQLNIMDATERMNKMTGDVTMVQTPQGQIPMRYPQAAPPSQAGPFIPNVPGPTQQRYNPQTQQMEFVGVLPNGGMGGGQGGGNPFPAGTPAGPSLGAEAAANTASTFAAGQGNTLQGRADQVPTSKAILGNLEAELDTPGFTTGPGTETTAKLAKFVNAQTGANFRAEGLSAREQFNKLSAMLAQSQFQALGGTGTDAKLDATTLTSPNSDLSKMGNKGIIALLKGNEDAIAAKNQAWQAFQQQNGPQSYGKFSTEFNKAYDPRVFQAQYLDDANKKKMISGLSQQEKNTLFKAFATAKQNGWIK